MHIEGMGLNLSGHWREYRIRVGKDGGKIEGANMKKDK